MINGLSFPNLKVLASVTLEDVENTQISLVDITDIYLTSYSGIVGITITSSSNLRLMINSQGASGDAETDDPGFWIYAYHIGDGSVKIDYPYPDYENEIARRCIWFYEKKYKNKTVSSTCILG